MMKQPHTEQTVEHTDGQQNTGNHSEKPKAPGGARTGAQNVEKTGKDKSHDTGKAKPD
jgi:hypothetical protein